MTGRLTRAIERVAIGLLTVAAVVVLAPVAAATPESDADDAITAAWHSNGGDTGPLGPKDGGVYPVGDGFGQNFAGGKIYFTPATGAHVMQGAILEKYESLGGPVDSDLGFPTIDEGAGRAADSRNTTFSAADKPVIFWTPATGAWVVRGAINAAWDKLGGSAGPLGVPAEDEAYKGDVVTQKFTVGELSWNRQAKAFTTVPPELAGQLAGLEVPEDATTAINAARRAAGGPLGPLGAKQGGQYAIGPDGVGQDFAGGKIFYTPATGANVVTGQVLKKYETVGGPLGDLGFPTSSEADGGLQPASRISTFAAPDKPVIFWTPDYGAAIVRGAMNAAWAKLGGATGPLGAPIADQTQSGTVITQRFAGGEISWDKATNRFTTQPANLVSSLSGLQVPGYEPPSAPKSSPASNVNGHKWFGWHWWWFLVIVPVALLVVGLVSGLVRSRRRPGVAAPVAALPAADDYRFGGRDDHRVAPAREWGPPAPVSETPPIDEHEAEGEEVFGSAYDPYAVDTVPTRIAPHAEPHRARHAALDVDEPYPARAAIHLPLDDPYQAPEGYPIKADTKSGRYWAPDSEHYHDAMAEIWFASEELARTNGFVRGD
jgi:uncharacterized protein with LGFP repeats